MKVGINGLNLIEHFEGLRLRAYQCSARVWTVGYGHPANVRPDDVITEEEADSFLHQDIANSERAVNINVMSHSPKTSLMPFFPFFPLFPLFSTLVLGISSPLH